MQASVAQTSDFAIKQAVGALFATENRRMLGQVLGGAPQTFDPATTSVATTLPGALRVAITSVNSAGEGSGVYPALQDNPRLQPLVNADPERVVRLAAEALTSIPQASQTHQNALFAAYRRRPALQARPRLQLVPQVSGA